VSRVDIYHSRRSSHDLCAFWIRNEDGIGNSDEYFYKTPPTGYFYAKEINPETVNNNVIMGMFMADQHHIMLESTDDLSDMTENSRVRFNGEIWRVESLQKTPIIKENELCRFKAYYWYISLVR
jgi:hypothetical protein